jgi:hypothetical protein
MQRGMQSMNSSEGDKEEKGQGRDKYKQRENRWNKDITAEKLLEGTYEEDGIIPVYDKEWYKK